jgi:hypothetical protein
MEKSGAKPRRIEPPKWTPELAYFVGLMAADGNLSKDGRHLNLVSKDKDLLEQVKEKMEIRAKIAPHYRSGERLEKFKAWHLQFGDVVLYRWLVSIGMTPRKSKTIKKVDVPDQFFSHFLRGLFDGDGSIYSYWDKRWKSSYMYYVSFTSGSKPFLDWLQERIYTLYTLKGHQSSSTRCYQLKYSKHRARELLYVMYEDATIRLRRKSEKVHRIWDYDPQVFADAFGVT